MDSEKNILELMFFDLIIFLLLIIFARFSYNVFYFMQMFMEK